MLNGLSNMFTIPIEKFSVPNWDVWRDRILAQCDENSPQAIITNGRVSLHEMDTDYHDLVAKKAMPKYYWDVMDACAPILDQMAHETGLDMQKVVAMWHQTTANGKFHGVHNHGPVGVTAVLYVQFDPSVHKATTFIAPFTNFINGEIIDFIPEVKEGDIVFFPSYLAHLQEPNFSDVPRTIISFNVMGKEMIPHKVVPRVQVQQEPLTRD